MSEAASVDIQRARDRFVDTVTIGVIAYLKRQGIVLTNRGETQLSDVIRFETTP